MPKLIRMDTSNGLLCIAEVADNHWTRLRGLLGRTGLIKDHGLWIKPCKSVHTSFMAFPIDVVYLTKDNVVAKTVSSLGPFHFSLGGPSARSAIELPAGTIALLDLKANQTVTISSAEA